jgi:hypothetical protein
MSSTRKDARWQLAMTGFTWDEWVSMDWDQKRDELNKAERSLDFMSEEAIEELARQWRME